MNIVLRRRMACLGAVASLLALQACQGLYLHNPDRAALAATAKKQIDSVDVGALGKTEAENIARITAEEVKAVQDRQKLVAQRAAIQLSASDGSIASHYQRAMARVGYQPGVTKSAGDCRLTLANVTDQILLVQDNFVAIGAQAPSCAANMPDTIPVPNGLDARFRQEFADQYSDLKGRCDVLQRTNTSCAGLLDPGGELAAAEAEATRRRDEAQAARRELLGARQAYDAAVAANKGLTDAAEGKAEDIKGKAQKVLDALGKLEKVAPNEADRVKSSALVDLLSAAAAGKAPEGEESSAVAIAAAVPSLAESIKTAQAAKRQVPVSHLLLALNNQVILAERNDRLAALDAEELAALRRKVQARDEQARLARIYSDNLCMLAVAGSGQAERSGACTSIQFQPSNGAPPVKCILEQSGQKIEIPNCLLGKSWRELFNKTPGTPVARRYLHEAAAAYLQLRLDSYQTHQEEFRRIDVAHRRTLVEREAALEQWKNLVAVPADQLAAYYAGGTKSAEIADLLVKALGLTAIAVGVSK